MARIYYRCEPFSKADVTLALESGVDGVIVPRARVENVAALSRCTVWACEDVASVPLNAKADEEALLARLKAGETACLARGWEIIPVENLLAQADNVLAEAGSLEEARLAAGILERGVDGIVVLPEALADLKAIVAQCKISQGREELQKAVITRVEPVGLGHRVCADTLSAGQPYTPENLRNDILAKYGDLAAYNPQVPYDYIVYYGSSLTPSKEFA